jgi:hypothetical protein
MKTIVILVFGMMLSIACSKKEASWETQEQARRTALENADFNAKKYRKENRPGWRIINRGDSTISATCPSGDGWVSVDLENTKTGQRLQLKCSSVSETMGCHTKVDFNKRDYAEQDGECNKKIPFPLPKIVR